MTFRDKITKIVPGEKVKDGMGGFTRKSDTMSIIKCKASLNTNPEVAYAYGTNGEQVLYVVSLDALDKEAFYLFNGMVFTLRSQIAHHRFFSSTLIEVKGGTNV